MASDLLASLKPWPIDDIVIGARTYRLPPTAALPWLEILLDEPVSLFAVARLLEPDASEHVEDLLIAGEYTMPEFENLIWDILAIAAGRPWWTALYLIASAKHVTNVEAVKGELVLAGVDPATISLCAWLDAVHRIFTRYMSSEDRQKFDLILTRPPAGYEVKTDVTANRAAFEALMSSG